ncbi:MAG: hypothetical protein RLZZ373_533, partial [Pseudomonadota bacterium]
MPVLKKPLLLSALACFAMSPALSPARGQTTAPPPAVRYQLDPGHTFIHWEVLHMGT